MLSADRRTLRGRIAALSQTRTADHPDLIAARSELAAVKAEEYVRQLADETALTPEQRARLAALLSPATADGGPA